MASQTKDADPENLCSAVARYAALIVGVWTASAWGFSEPTFNMTVVDQAMAGDCKMVGDIDGDGKVDAVVGGSISEGLAWYRWPDWTRFDIATPVLEFTTDGEVGDVDGDGDLDIVIPDGPAGNNLVWFENPRPGGNPATDTWIRHEIAALGDWGKDVELADFDLDGNLDVATRTNSVVRVHFRNPDGSWDASTIASGLSGEGMTSGDVDGDGDVDLVVARAWIDNPATDRDARVEAWTPYLTDQWMYVDAKAVVADLDNDGINEILYSNSERLGNVIRCEPTTGDPRGAWTISTIEPDIFRCHTLQVADMDLDGDLDVVLGQMHTSTQREIKVLYNTDGSGTSWVSIVVDDTGVHNAVVADFGGDGAPDIFGCNWTGNPPLRFWKSSAAGIVCRGDMTTQGAGSNDPGFGQPDGLTTGADISYYINLWIVEDDGSDMTTQGAAEGQPGYGTPDGMITGADISFFINNWLAGC